MEYRMAVKEDIELLMEVRLEMLRIVNELSDDFAFSDELTENSRQYFLQGNQSTSIAVENKKIIAGASISYIEVMPTFSPPTGKRAHLMNVYTNAAYRRQGISRSLVQMLIDDAKKKHITEISLDATDSGRPLYTSLGFSDSDECMTLKLF